MTSTATPQNSTQATNTAAPSYASAASASKKPAAGPNTLVASGSNPVPVVVGSSATSSAKPASASPANGRPTIAPAIPVVHGAVNGGAADHVRKPSVTISANGPPSYGANGGPIGSSKSNIQFGFRDSPVVSHSTPQPGASSPIPIPGSGNPRVASPAQSPSPIPQPAASGGRPPAGLQSGDVKPSFGSFNNDPERHMRQASIPPNNPALHNQPLHTRQGSNVSMASTGDMGNQGMPGPNRGNFHHGGRNRPFNPNNSPYNPQTGYPPQNSYRNGHGQGRNSMPPTFQPQPPPRGYANSPQPTRGSPAMMPSNPNTPNMAPAMPVQTPPQFYAPPMGAQPVQNPPISFQSDLLSFVSFPSTTLDNRVGFRQDPSLYDWGKQAEGNRKGSPPSSPPYTKRSSRYSKRGGKISNWRSTASDSYRPAPIAYRRKKDTDLRTISEQQQLEQQRPLHVLRQQQQLPSFLGIDLSPETENFKTIQKVLTERKQNMPGPYMYTPPGAQYPGPMPHMGYANYAMPYPGQSGSPAFAPPYGAPPFQPGGPAAMSRTPSTSEKPNLAAGPGNQPVVVSSPQISQVQGKPPVVSGSGNTLPRAKKSSAIVIKRPDGEIVDVANIKSSSPAPTSRTPPVVSSTATPPTKPSTPAHARTESVTPAKTKEDIQAELRNKIAQATAQTTQGPDSKADEAAKVEAEERAKAEAEAKAKQEAEEKAKAEQKAKEEAEKKAKEEAEEKAKKEAEEKAEAEAKKKEAAASSDPDEDEMERIIRELEEADRLREAEEEEHRKKAEAAKAEAKKKSDAERAIQAAENDRKLREAEREMERLEEEKERRAKANADSGKSFAELLNQARSGELEEPAESPKVDSITEKLANVSLAGDSKPPTPTSATGKGPDKQQRKPAALNLSLNTKPVEAPQPSAALQALKTSRFLTIKEAHDPSIYAGSTIASPNPAVNSAVGKRGQAFKYDAAFLLQFQNVFTEQPSLEFQSQVKSLIGDSDNKGSARTPAGSRPNARGAGGNTFPSMGSFSRTLPPGTTSEQRMAMASGAAPRPSIPGMGGFRGPSGQFPGSLLSNSGRQGSNSGMGPNSPRQASARGGGRQGSQRHGYNSQKDAQNAKTMPLTQGQELKPITVSATGWKPMSVGKKSAEGASDHLEPEMVQRKVKAALNKMTPENFDRISDQILTIANQSKNENDGRTLRQVIQLTFEKATDEPHFSSTYAKFCKRMLDQMSPEIKDDTIKDKHGNVVNGGNLFRKYLLNRCQEEYERGWSVPEKKEGETKPHGAELLSDEYYEAAAVKRRGLGLVRFIGELFKLGMLTERIIHGCVHGLVDFKDEPKEAEIESLCFLLRTVGAQLDASEKGKPMMDAYFKRIQNMIDLPELENRLKFMLMDVRDLRDEGWKSVEANKGPKTLEEVRVEAERVAAAKAAEAARSQRGGGGPRPQMGRGDARSLSSGYGQATNVVGMDDLKRLKSNSKLLSSGVTLGPHSMLASRSNSGRRPGGPGALGRSGDNSGMSSRTGTPPTRESSNTFGLLATMDSENPVSPPSTAASPALSKVVPDTGDKKKP
ncbi:hypothetical protein jhhlp_006874 [Lomentospora prolificans]|uniref:MIF4G domain-containing protein n=1 Tax=Lomentospora prolificans TaxID=41688 RepID=A0A2N3N2Z4_9PEZI|nr:hypothetical protein jhhlp_006874 [Lomentospora prolificans]